MSPMCQYSSTDGFSTDWHLVHLGSRAVGGAALVITEATAVTKEGRISPNDLGIWKDEHIEGLKRITDFIHLHGAVAGIQLAHAGRKASMSSPWLGNKLLDTAQGGWRMVAPSAIAFDTTYGTPTELGKEDILNLVNSFGAAAQRALRAGFKLIELHGAHGYLINEFLSPLSNKRTDEYGGSFENRIRFLLEIIQAVRKVWTPGLPLFLRISASDWVDGGWTIDDSVRLATIVKNEGVDLIDCSSGGIVPYAKIPAGPSYQVPFAQAIKTQTGILTGAVGIITDAQQAESILVTGQADVIVMAREMLRNPYFALTAADELGNKDMKWPVQYERAKRSK